MRRSGTKAPAESAADIHRQIKEDRELIMQGILPDVKEQRKRTRRLLPDGDWVGFISGIEWEHGSRVPTQIRLMVGGEPIRYDLHVEQPEPVLTFKSNIFKK